ncbi:DUF7503 family protein [Halorussus halobius]
MANTSDLKEWLAENPKMMGALSMLLLLLSQAGNVVAGSCGGRAGP